MQYTDILEQLIVADRSLTNFLHDVIPHTPFFDLLFSFLSVYGNSVIAWLIILFLLLVFEGKRHKKFPVYLLAGTITTFLFVEFVLKNLYGRARPLRLNDTLLSICPESFSFPSGHAAVAFAAAFIFSYFDKKRSVIYYILAFLICLSRIYLQCHYLIDILGGMIVGITVAKITTISLQKHLH